MELEVIHQMFVGPSLNNLQASFYGSGKLGVSSTEKDPDITDATLVRALSMARQGFVFFPVTILTPAAYQEWVEARIYAMATHCMEYTSEVPHEKRSAALVMAQNWLQSLILGPPVPELKRWVAIGYDKATVPTWIKEQLFG